MGILAWILFGLVAGALAKFLMPGKDPGGIIITILIGIAGAFLGGYLGTRFGIGNLTGFDIRSLGLAIVGSLILLAVYRFLRQT